MFSNGPNALAKLAAGLALAATAPAGAALEERRFEAASSWSLDYGEERCSLARTFGAAEEPLEVRIDSFGSWRSFRVLVFGKAIPRPYTVESPFKYRFTPDAEARDGMVLNGIADGHPAVSFSAEFAVYERFPENLSHREQLARGAAGPPGARI